MYPHSHLGFSCEIFLIWSQEPTHYWLALSITLWERIWFDSIRFSTLSTFFHFLNRTVCFFSIAFRERGRERWGVERENTDVRNIDHLPPVCTPTGDPTRNLGMCPDWELNSWLFGAQDKFKPTEPHQPGQDPVFLQKVLLLLFLLPVTFLLRYFQQAGFTLSVGLCSNITSSESLSYHLCLISPLLQLISLVP